MGTERRLLIVLGVLAVCALAAGSVQAARRHKPKLPYSSGTYSGLVTQLLPTAGTGEIRFRVAGRVLSGISVKVFELCGGVIPSLLGDSPRSFDVRISPSGSFAYDNAVQGDHLQLKGRLHGRQASGTFFDTLQTGTLLCTMDRPANFTAFR